MDEVSDAEIVATSLDDASVFGLVFDRHALEVLRFLVRRVGRDAGEDLLGEVFRVAFETRARFDLTRANARPWLFGIANNLVRHHRRSEERRLRAVAAAAGAAATGSDDPVAGDALAKALASRTAEHVIALPDGERDVLLLVAFEELSYEDVAFALGIPIGTVRSRLNRARGRLRDLLLDGGGSETRTGGQP